MASFLASRSVMALALVAAGLSCDAREPAPSHAGKVPPVLSELLLARDSDEIPPIVFPHGEHQHLEFQGKPIDCAYCHHTLAEAGWRGDLLQQVEGAKERAHLGHGTLAGWATGQVSFNARPLGGAQPAV